MDEEIRTGESELEANEKQFEFNLVEDIRRGSKHFWDKRGGDPADRHRWNRRGNFATKRNASGNEQH